MANAIAEEADDMEALQPFIPLILLFVLMWFLLIRPQQIQARKRQEMLARVKAGDQVITIGGLHGEITQVIDDLVRIKFAEGVEVTMNKTGVGVIKEPANADA